MMCVSVLQIQHLMLDGGSLPLHGCRRDMMDCRPNRRPLSGLCRAPGGVRGSKSTAQRHLKRGHNAWMTERLSNVCEGIHGDTGVGTVKRNGRIEIRMEEESSSVCQDEEEGERAGKNRGQEQDMVMLSNKHCFYTSVQHTWESLWDYSLLDCDYMVVNSAKVSHF